MTRNAAGPRRYLLAPSTRAPMSPAGHSMLVLPGIRIDQVGELVEGLFDLRFEVLQLGFRERAWYEDRRAVAHVQGRERFGHEKPVPAFEPPGARGAAGDRNE